MQDVRLGVMKHRKPSIYDGLTEREFLDSVIATAHDLGWRVAHFRPAQTEKGWRTAVQADGVGFPDLIMLKRLSGNNVKCVVAELKSERGKPPTADQIAWLELFKDVRQIHVALLKPSDIESIVIELGGLV